MSQLRSLSPIIAMIVGVTLSSVFDPLTPAIPVIIAGMLFFAFLEVKPSQLRLVPSHFALLALQLGMALGSYWLFRSWGQVEAEGLFICFFTPAATAGPAIVLLLRGRVPYTTSYVLLSHLMVVLLGPILLPLIHGGDGGHFAQQAWAIFLKVFPMVGPAIALAWGIKWLLPKLGDYLTRQRSAPFLLWISSVLILMAHNTEFLKARPEIGWRDLLPLIIISLLTTALQYALGAPLARLLGSEPIATRHALGQKNTSLSLWLASLYLSPLTPMAIAGVILWQNIILAILMKIGSPYPPNQAEKQGEA